MKFKLTFLLVFLSLLSFSQEVIIDSTSFEIKHGDLIFYLDKDTNTFVSVHKVTYQELLKIDGVRNDKWHKEFPFGPYNRKYYLNTGYDLGHLTPSNITSYDDTLNFHSFSLFNQAPQLAGFNRGKWSQLESKTIDLLLKQKVDAIIITGVLYNNLKKEYLYKSRIKIPINFYKIIIINNKGVNDVKVWIGSNLNGLLTPTDLKTLLEIAKQNNNEINILIK